MIVLLDQRMQAAVRRLLMTEPEPGTLFPTSALESLGLLAGCDRIGIGEADRTGYLLRDLSLPPADLWDLHVCDGPLPPPIR